MNIWNKRGMVLTDGKFSINVKIVKYLEKYDNLSRLGHPVLSKN